MVEQRARVLIYDGTGGIGLADARALRARGYAVERLGRPEDIGALAAFLVSAEAAWITGQVIGVDGGRCSAPCTEG